MRKYIKTKRRLKKSRISRIRISRIRQSRIRESRIRKNKTRRKQHGGGCSRTQINSNCFENKCVDYANKVFEPIKTIECHGWVKHFDTEAGAYYYYNTKTNEAVWTKPDVYSEEYQEDESQEEE